MNEIKYLSEPFKFLYDSGLLYEINRAVLHPHGLSLEVSEDDETGDFKFHGIRDARYTDEHFCFDVDTNELGTTKLFSFKKTPEYKNKTKSRREYLGYRVQPFDGDDV